MATVIRVTPEALDSAAGNIESIADDYKTQYESFYTLIGELNHTFTGEAYDAFKLKVEEFKDDFGKMWTEMNEYSTFLRNSATAYRNTQEDAKTRAQNLKGNYNG